MNINIFSEFPVFEHENIILRELTTTDAEFYLKYMNKPEMLPFVTRINIPSSLTAAEEELNYWRSLFYSKRSFYWGIALKENNQLIGTAGFNNISLFNRRGEISYDLDHSFWKKGIMLKSVNTILKFADLMLGLARTQATVITDNSASIKLLERCNFKQEGLLRKYEIVNNEFKDYYMYARVH